MLITSETINKIILKLDKHAKYPFLASCVNNVASRWQDNDGSETEFYDFCLKHYINDAVTRKKTFHKILEKIERAYGLSLSLYWSNAWNVMMQTGELEPVDTIFAEMDPNTHLLEDFYKSKLALFILLNFPLLSLQEKQKLTEHPDDRYLLAMSRCAELCQFRIPLEVSQQLSTTVSQVFQYLGHLMFDLNRIFINEHALFQQPLQVDCHWGLRDQINLHYQAVNGLATQQILAKIWERVILEEVPSAYYENKTLCWDPIANQLFDEQKKSIRQDHDFYKGRYAVFKQLFDAKKAEDKYSLALPNFITRNFEAHCEMHAVDVREMMTSFLTNPLLPHCAAKLKTILKRELYPFDVIFNQFGLSTQVSPGQYDTRVVERYPTLAAFKKAIPNILVELGFSLGLAQKIGKRIRVAQCRSGGFASFPKMRGGEYILAVAAHDEKMDFMAFSTAMHELGHCVERYLSSENIDYYTLGEVPSNAFTEAFAFLFDSKSLELLGIQKSKEAEQQAKILNLFWTAYLNCGLGLVDLECWEWMYQHADFSVDELKQTVLQIACRIWNQYYAPILGEKDSLILAGYSPMLINPLYMPNYAMAIFIQTQLDDYLKDKILGQEMPRICSVGRLTPNAWMKHAVGEAISSRVLLKLTESAM